MIEEDEKERKIREKVNIRFDNLMQMMERNENEQLIRQELQEVHKVYMELIE